MLSSGEQQRLAFARLLLIRPKYALLDEATSALDVKNEDRLYRLLRDTSITIISVSHHASLLKYHAQVLELTGQAKWELHSAKKFRFSE